MSHSTWRLSSVLLLFLLLATQEVQGKGSSRGGSSRGRSSSSHSYSRRGSASTGHVVHSPPRYTPPKPRGPPPAYSPRNTIGGGRTNVHEAPPSFNLFRRTHAPPPSYWEATNTYSRPVASSASFYSGLHFPHANGYLPQASGRSGGYGGGGFNLPDYASFSAASNSLLRQLSFGLPSGSRYHPQPPTEAPRRAPSSFATFRSRTAYPAPAPVPAGGSQLGPLSGVEAPQPLNGSVSATTTTSTTPPPSLQVRDPKDPTSSAKVDAYPPPSEGTPAVVGTVEHLTVQ